MSQIQQNLRTTVFSKLSEIVKTVSGIDMAHADADANFLELGIDSLMLVRINQGIKKHFGIEISMIQFYENTDTINKITDFLASGLQGSLDLKAENENQKNENQKIENQKIENQTIENQIPDFQTPVSNFKADDAENAVERIMFQQMQAMSQLISQQLEVLKILPLQQVKSEKIEGTNRYPSASQPLPKESKRPVSGLANVNLRGMKLEHDALTLQQQTFLKNFIERYVSRSKKSRELVQKYRPFLSDWINSLGFRLALKEIMYPIVGPKSEGSKIWDIDGNAYLDIAIGYGVSFFGNRPKFIINAIQEQLVNGFELGPQSDLAGEVAKLVCELTGAERAAFCNTGSESVMFAIRIARAFTGRKKIVLFSGSYHGNSDGVLAAPSEDGKSFPAAPGTTDGMVQDVIVLNYGVPESIERIKAHAHELAAVLVEPVQSRRPGFQPKEFLLELRELTLKEKIILIFDEMITGFRIHPGGAQAWFGVKADLATYGKIVAGGMPIGVVAGKAQYMNLIDGGMWQFGDNSHPKGDMIFFAGTFCKHPLTMAAAKAALTFLKEQGQALQQHLNERTSYFAKTLNQFFEQENIAIRLEHFGSLFRFESFGKYHQLLQPIEMDIFFYLLLEKGIYTWEKRVSFFSIAHSDEDIEYIIAKVKETIYEMRQGGFTIEADKSKKKTPSIIDTQNLSDAKKFESLPINEAQKQLWFLAHLNENAISAYVESLALELKGTLKPELLKNAVLQVVNRHEALRTVFASDGETQSVLETIQVEIPLIDFSEYWPAVKDHISNWLTENSNRKMNPETGPLFRFSLLKLQNETHILVANFHHMVADGYSLLILLQEVCDSYTALCEGKNATLCEGKNATIEPVPQYRDFMQWQKTYFESDKCKEDEKFWLDLFPNGLPMPDFPTDYIRPNIFTFNGARYQIKCDAELYKQIKPVGKKHRCTPFMTMIGAYTALLHRITGSPEIVIGFPSAGRFFENSEKVTGYCAHLVPFYSRLDFNMTFDDYLEFVRQNLLKAYEHQQYPFSKLIRKLNLAQDMSRGSAISFEFNLDRFTGFPKMSGLEIEQFDLPLKHAKYDLILDVLEIGDDISLKFEYATDLFAEDRIKRLAGHYLAFLKEIVANSGQPIGRLSLLTEAERHQILVEWNNTKRDIPKNKCFHELFEEQALKTPNQIAAIFESEKISYYDLNRKADCLAKILVEQGVKADFIVAILAERSIEFLITILGVFKAGGAYLPLDPLHPVKRIHQILKESKASLVLTEKNFLSVINEATAMPLEKYPKTLILDDLILDDLSKQEVSKKNVTARCTPNDLAYVIYTSGSTGVPKGAMVEHKGMLNHLYAKIFDLDLTENDTVVQNASQCFDISVWQFLSGLLVGGKTCICKDEIAHDPVLLLDLVVKNRVTILELVPSLLRMISDEINRMGNKKPDLSGLRRLIPTGEALPPSLCAQWLAHYPNIPVMNAYGPTECSDDVAHYLINTPPRPEISNIPIGRPIINMRLYILDSQLQPVPIGVIGELYVGGIGVGRGYLNNPGKTAEAFIADPFESEKNARLYKTGDIAKYLPDGNIEFLGRIDHQVKVRGFRIELGEIEAVINLHPSVRETVVMAREDNPGDQRIVAYFVTKPEIDKPLDINELRTYLTEKLPDYMIPSHFVHMKNFQLTSNGKIDRKALPKPENSQTSTETPYKTPESDFEKAIANVWQSVLKVEKIGVLDNYFSLGGDSIKSIQIVSRLKEENLKLQIKDIFLYPTIAELALRATRIDRIIDQGTVTGDVLLTAIQSWFFKTYDRANHYNQAVILDSKQSIRADAARAVLEKIQEHHDALRMKFKFGKPETIGFNCDVEYPFEFDIMDLKAKQDAISSYETYADKVQASIDLENGHMMKSVLFRLPDRDRLLIVIHHSVMDGVSWQILLEDFTLGYEQYLKANPNENYMSARRHSNENSIRFPLKTDSFKKWAEKIRSYSNSETLLKEKTYWKSLDTLPVKPLSKDYETNDNLYGDITTSDFSLSPEETNSLTHNVNQAYHTDTNDILLVSLVRAIKQTGETVQTDKTVETLHATSLQTDKTGKNRTAIMLEGHGREQLFDDTDITRTIGWFTSEYPVILELQSDDMAMQIKTVKETLHRIPKKGIGYGILKYLTTAEQISFKLNPQISFNYLGQFDDIKEGAFEFTTISDKHSIDPKLSRKYDLEIEAMVIRGQLKVTIYYNKKHFKPETANEIASKYKSELLSVISHCENKKTGELTPLDLTYSNLTLNELDELLTNMKIEKNNLKDIYPLAPMQEGMLFHALYKSESVAYFEQFSFSMSGDLNIKMFETGWNELLKRYDILRTVFAYKETARPLQIVLKEKNIDFVFNDIRAMNGDTQNHIERFKQEDRKKGFDLSKDVLTRLTVFQTGENSYKAIWSYHHILMDGWCLGILVKELLEYYQSMKKGQKPALKPASLQYVTYIKWLENADKQSSKQYWSDYLAGYKQLATLPKIKDKTVECRRADIQTEKAIECRRADIQTELSKIAGKQLSENATKRLYQLAAKYQVTVNTVIQTAWGVLLGYYNGTDDVVFGVAVSGRPSDITGVENIVGLFLNTVPIRIATHKTQRLDELIKKVQADSLAGEAYHYYSLAEIQTATDTKQNLLDHVLIFQNFPFSEELYNIRKEFKLDFSIEAPEIFEQTGYDLSIEVNPGAQMGIDLRYNTLVFSDELIKKVVEQLIEIIEVFIGKPETTIVEIEKLLLSKKEKQEETDFLNASMAINEDF